MAVPATLRSLATASILLVLACARSDELPEVAAAEEQAQPLPDLPFPAPTGNHAVGMREEQWVDDSRKDPFTSDPDDLRRVPVRFWYPARPAPGSMLAPYIVDPREFEGVEAILRAAHVRSHAFFEAPVDTPQRPYPVLVYHHGGGWPRFVGTALAEELVSHGYVVVAVGHDGFNQATRRPDGSSAVPDALPFPEESGDLRSDALAAWDHLERHYFPQWVADARFVLDRLHRLADEGSWPLANALDLERVGSYGWSFGGATAIETLVTDPRVKAAADLDGQLFGSAASRGTAGPFLLLGAEDVGLPDSEDAEEAARIAEAGAELLALVENDKESLIARSSGPWHRFQIAGTSHGSFSDFLHFAPAGESEIEPGRGHEVLSQLVRAFFDRYLKGAAAPLLDDPGATYPEVTAVRRAP